MNISVNSRSNKTGSSIYVSRQGKKVTELKSSRKDIEESNIIESKPSIKNGSKIVSSIKPFDNKQSSSSDIEFKSSYRFSDNKDKSGLENKYLLSSIEKAELENHEEEKWEVQQEVILQTLTSDSFWSMGSVPDEYTVFNTHKSKIEDKSIQFTNNSKEIEYPSKPSIELFPNWRNNKAYGKETANNKEELVTEEDELSHEIGDEKGNSMYIPSMITHLKRKDNYRKTLCQAPLCLVPSWNWKNLGRRQNLL